MVMHWDHWLISCAPHVPCPTTLLLFLLLLLSYLSAKEAEALNRKSASRGMWRFLGVYDQEEKTIRGREAVVDRQLYGELKRWAASPRLPDEEGEVEDRLLLQAHKLLMPMCLAFIMIIIGTCANGSSSSLPHGHRYGFEYLILPVMAIGGIYEVQQLLKAPSEREQEEMARKSQGLVLGR